MSFNLPAGPTLFKNVSLTIAKQKIGLVGRNGVGKSTLFKLITGDLSPTSGAIETNGVIVCMPQDTTPFAEMTVADLLGYSEKLNALSRIEQGMGGSDDFETLNDDWLVKEHLKQQLSLFGLENTPYHSMINSLSGGELTRLLLTKIFSSKADFLLLDEPTNHLDKEGRMLLQAAIRAWPGGIIVASHDRELLNQVDEIIEISSQGVTCFGGNYEFYKEQKECLSNARNNQLLAAENFLTKTKQSVQSSKEKHEQRQAKGKELRKRRDQPKILLDAMKNRSTASKKALLIRHNRMLDSAQEKLRIAKEQCEQMDEINVSLPKTCVPNGKIILEIKDCTFAYSKSDQPIINGLNLIIQGPERIAFVGNNGSGKTTLIKLILDSLEIKCQQDTLLLKPSYGTIKLSTTRISYLDQKVEQLNPELTILDNFLQLNPEADLNQAYAGLAQFLFKNTAALKVVKQLSGGEKLRALLASLLLSSNPPQLLILDEPTNHLDLQSILSIESILKNFQGAMIVISHDQDFLNAVGVEKVISTFKT
jgi:ATPase subunit of ABC transporter with duplicated ATPase domains